MTSVSGIACNILCNLFQRRVYLFAVQWHNSVLTMVHGITYVVYNLLLESAQPAAWIGLSSLEKMTPFVTPKAGISW